MSKSLYLSEHQEIDDRLLTGSIQQIERITKHAHNGCQGIGNHKGSQRKQI